MDSLQDIATEALRSEAGPARETLIPVAFVPMLPGLPQEARTSDEREKGI